MKDIFLYDVHTHTNMEPLLSNLDNILFECNNKKIIWNCIGTCLDDSKIAVEQANKHKGKIFATIGIHPDNCKNISDIEQLEKLYLENRDVIVAIGECGLDYYATKIDKTIQKKFFIKQIELANKYNLPICIHVRDAEEDCLEALKLIKNQNKVWIHCFAKGKNWVEKYNQRGYMMSVPGIVTFKNAKEIHESIKFIPLDKLMIETDGPWLAPEPFRGKTNMPYYVEYTLNNISDRLQINKDALAKQITQNSIKFFNIK